MSSAIIESTYLAGMGKQGILKPDSQGRYEMVVGAYDCINNIEKHYAFAESVRQIYTDPNSDLNRRLNRKLLRGEVDHPSLSEYLEKFPNDQRKAYQFYFQRCMNIDPRYWSHHFHSFRLDDTAKDHEGRSIVLVYAVLEPFGPYATTLAEGLKNPDMNVCFSVRCLSRPIKLQDGRESKLVNNVLTYDHVPEGGIYMASKYDTPTLESFHSAEFNELDLLMLEKTREANPVSLESGAIDTTMVRSSLGWQKIELVKPGSSEW